MSSFTSTSALSAFCPALKRQEADVPPEQATTRPDRPERLISFDELHHRTGLSRTTIWRLERAGQFPRSVRISPGRRAWREADISAWIEAKLSFANGGQ
jgi:predicted DNA-binding transcriptional regulator AlpA